MKRILITLCLFTLGSAMASAAVVLSGIVTYQNTGKRMEAIQVSARGASPVITRMVSNKEGRFDLRFEYLSVGMEVKLNIESTIYEVVNEERELTVVLAADATYLVRIVVCNRGERERNKLYYYNISLEPYNKKLATKSLEIDALNLKLQTAVSDKQALQDTLNAKNRELDLLKSAFEDIKTKAWDYADEFSKMDTTLVNASYKKAFKCFLDGKIDEARAILGGSEKDKSYREISELDREIMEGKDVTAKAEEALEKKKEKIRRAESEKKESVELQIKSDLFEARLALLSADYAKNETILKRALTIAPQNFELIKRLVEQYISQYRYAEAISVCENYVKNTTNPIDEANAIFLTSKLLRLDKQYDKSIQYQAQAAEAFRKIAQGNSAVYIRLAETLMDMGTCYCLYQIDEQAAIAKAEEGLAIYREQALASPEEFNFLLIDALLEVAEFMERREEYKSAEQYFMEGFNLLENLTKRDHSVQIQEKYAELLGKKGEFFENAQQRKGGKGREIKIAKQSYEDAVRLYTQLALSDTTGVYTVKQAAALISLGHYYQIYETCTEYLSETESPELLEFITPLVGNRTSGGYNNWWDDILYYSDLYETAIKILTEAVKDHPLISNKEIFAAAYSSIAGYYFEALEIYDNMDNQYDMPENNICGFNGQCEKVVNYIKKSIALYSEIAPQNPLAYEPEIAMLYASLGECLTGTACFDTTAGLYFQRAVQISEDCEKRDSATLEHYEKTATYLTQLGNFYVFTGEKARADKLFEKALLRRKRLVRSSPDLTFEFNKISNLIFNLADYFAESDAPNRLETELKYLLSIYEKVEKNRQSLPEFFKSAVAGITTKLGIYYKEKGDLELATQYFQTALKQMDTVAPKIEKRTNFYTQTLFANAYINEQLGLIYSKKIDKKRALDCFEEAMKGFVRAKKLNGKLIADLNLPILISVESMVFEYYVIDELTIWPHIHYCCDEDFINLEIQYISDQIAVLNGQVIDFTSRARLTKILDCEYQHPLDSSELHRSARYQWDLLKTQKKQAFLKKVYEYYPKLNK